jgi:hypothetical protein
MRTKKILKKAKNLENELWFKQVINCSDNLVYLNFLKKNFTQIRDLPKEQYKRFVRDLNYRISKIEAKENNKNDRMQNM